jgi:peroxiredoxin/uncharacterized membrane protein YphA (DoxX/SURF4 family)
VAWPGDAMAGLVHPLALLLLRLLLAGVLAWSGSAKLADRRDFRVALADFGVPTGLARPAAAVLPLVELAVAVALVPGTSAWGAALAAVSLLVAFTLVLVVSLARGRRPECHCFGSFSSRPVSWRTVGRNGVLVAAAAVLVARGPAGPWLGPVAQAARLSGAELSGLAVGVVLLVIVVAQGWLNFHLLRQHGQLLLRLDAAEAELAGRAGPVYESAAGGGSKGHAGGLAVGIPAPEFTLPALDGRAYSLRALLAAGQPVGLAFVHPGCGSCTALLPELARWHSRHASRLSLTVITTGTAEANRQTAEKYGPVLVQQDREVSDAYAVRGTPSLVMVGADGRISSPMAAGAPAIRTLLAGIATEQVRAAAAGHGPDANGHEPLRHPASVAAAGRIGSPAPSVRLPDLAGNLVDLAGFRGQPVLLLFWNPGCGFCRQMLGDLRTWEATRNQDMPQLLVVSGGPVEANQAMGLRAAVVLDPGFASGQAFGAHGTPSAVLIDGEGRIASGLAVGGQAVLALATTRAMAGQRGE